MSYKHMHLLLYYTYVAYSITVAISQVTGVRLTCESVGLIDWCNATWQVSNSLLYVHTYVVTYVCTYIATYVCMYVRICSYTYMHIHICNISSLYEPPKAAKEHATYTACQVPSQSKSITKNFPYKESKILLF